MLKKTKNFLITNLFKINDSPHKIALGMALGIFCGLLPGTGPLAALTLAFIFKANRAASLLGSFFTNTWLSFVTFILAIKVGSAILNLNWIKVKESTETLFRNFKLLNFLTTSFDLLLPVLIGYLVIGLILSAFGYLITLYVIRRKPNGSKTIHP